MKVKTSNLIILLLAALAIIAGLLIYWVRGSIYSEAEKYSLVPQPQRFTELYFVNPGRLPSKIPAGKQISFSFIIHNLQGATTTYPYLVNFQSTDGQSFVFDQSTVTLPNDGYKTVSVTHKFKTTNQAGKVEVDLTSINQSIDFLLATSTVQ